MNDSTIISGEDPPHRILLQRLALFIGIALILATLCNGAGFYLRRVGVIDAEAYRTYWSFQCNKIAYYDPNRVLGPGCSAYIKANQPRLPTEADELVTKRIARSVYKTPAREIPLKLVKDVLGLVLIGLSAALIARRRATWPALREAWPLLLLLGYVMGSYVASWTAQGAMTATLGLRPFMFLVIALSCRWLAPHLSIIAQCLAVLLGTEALLAALEVLNDKHMIGQVFTTLPAGSSTLAVRATGTLIQPNTLGIFAAASLAFYYTFSRSRSYLALLSSIALVLILASGSATGILCILCFLLFIVMARIAPQRRPFVAVVGILAFLIVFSILPVITGRPPVFNSIFGAGGRLDVFRFALADKSALELMFGRGIGLNTNLALNLLRQASPDALTAAGALIPRSTDSTVTGLLVQIGILGTLMFYACILWASLRDPDARMFYAIIFLCSLTLNIGEVFPVNYLLGLALARSLAVARRE